MPALIADQPPVPQEFAHLLLALGRFPAPLDWAAFESFARMTGRTFARWELDVILHIDRERQQ